MLGFLNVVCSLHVCFFNIFLEGLSNIDSIFSSLMQQEKQICVFLFVLNFKNLTELLNIDGIQFIN